jgi:hypothetical protein
MRRPWFHTDPEHHAPLRGVSRAAESMDPGTQGGKITTASPLRDRFRRADVPFELTPSGQTLGSGLLGSGTLGAPEGT